MGSTNIIPNSDLTDLISRVTPQIIEIVHTKAGKILRFNK